MCLESPQARWAKECCKGGDCPICNPSDEEELPKKTFYGVTMDSMGIAEINSVGEMTEEEADEMRYTSDYGYIVDKRELELWIDVIREVLK